VTIIAVVYGIVVCAHVCLYALVGVVDSVDRMNGQWPSSGVQPFQMRTVVWGKELMEALSGIPNVMIDVYVSIE
jgi:hypothetical protein